MLTIRPLPFLLPCVELFLSVVSNVLNSIPLYLLHPSTMVCAPLGDFFLLGVELEKRNINIGARWGNSSSNVCDSRYYKV